MSASGLPEDVRRFIIDSVDSVEQLEILLLLHQHRDRAWDAEAVARELRVSPLSAGERLRELAADGLLEKRGGKPAEYRYAPASPKLDEAVRGLVTAYAERRVTVINLIFSKPVDRIRTFADAFRFRKDDDDHG